MRSLRLLGLLFAASVYASTALGHGFDLSVDSYANPSSFIIASAQPVLDDDPNNPTPGPGNLFLDAFNDTPNGDGSYGTFEGFAQTSGPFPFYTAPLSTLSARFTFRMAPGRQSRRRAALSCTYMTCTPAILTETIRGRHSATYM